MERTTGTGTARRLAGPLLVAGAVAAGAVALHVRDPHVQGSWGLCPFSVVTGLDCPGCGSLRAVNLLGNGDVVGAASSNLLLTLAVPVVAVAWVVWLLRAARPGPARSTAGHRLPVTLHVALFVLLVGVVVAFTVLRNTPAGAWLHS